MNRRLFAILLTILACLNVSAQDMSQKGLANTAWKVLFQDGGKAPNTIVIAFTDSCINTSVYTNNGTKAELGHFVYYLSDKKESAFDDKKVGKPSSGSWIIEKNEGMTMCEKAIPLSNNKWRLISNNGLTFDLTKITSEELASLDSQVESNDTYEMNNIMNDLCNEQNTRNIFLPYAGTLQLWLNEIPEAHFKTADKLKISGPLNGLDIDCIREMISAEDGKDAKFSNIKTLDLSRAWIVTDTIGYKGIWGNCTHKDFVDLKGKRSIIDINDSSNFTPLREELGISKITRLQNEDGDIFEIIPDSIYLEFPLTSQNTLTSEILSDMPDIESIYLPYTTNTVTYDAICNCPKLKEIHSPRIEFINPDGTISENFEGTQNFAVKYYGEKQPDINITLSLKNAGQSKSKYLITNASYSKILKKMKADEADQKFTFTVPQYSSILINSPYYYNAFIADKDGGEYIIDVANDKISGSDLNDKLNKQMKSIKESIEEINYCERERLHQTDADSIKSYNTKMQLSQKAIQDIIRTTYLDNKDSNIGIAMLNLFKDFLDKGFIQFTLAIMNERNAFDPIATNSWEYIMQNSGNNIMGQYDLADTTQMARVHVAKAGTLQSTMTDEEWKKTERLYISGSIDKNDIQWLHHITRSNDEEYQLYAIDMSKAVIAYMPDSAFFNSTNLAYISLPKTLKEVPQFGFFECRNLKSIVIPDGMERIDRASFDGCNSLKEVNIPSSVRTIGFRAFLDCNALKKVELHEGLDSIFNLAFKDCSNLKNINIPASVRFLAPKFCDFSSEQTLTISPENNYYTIVEGQIVGKTLSAKVKLGQVNPKTISTEKKQKATDNYTPVSDKVKVTYKIVTVNGKKQKKVVKVTPIKKN